MTIRTVPVVSGRHPFQVAVLVAAVSVGTVLAITAAVPKSAAAMPPLVQALWVFLLISSGAVALLGAFWRGHVGTALGLELAGVLLLAGGTSMYAVALFAVSGMQALAAGGFVVSLAGASWWRAGQIRRDLRQLSGGGT